jgi:DNA-binding CsgD family transcriptional regulator
MPKPKIGKKIVSKSSPVHFIAILYLYLDNISRKGSILSYEIILNELISKLVHPLKQDTALELALKAKLTKKELKLLKLLAQKATKESIKQELKFDQEELDRVERNLVKKLNQEKTKQAIYNI